MAKTSMLGRLGSLLRGISRLRPKLARRTILEASILGMVLVIAVVFRVIRIRWGTILDEYDPLFQYRVTEYVVRNGYSAWFSWHDTLSWYPMGRDIFKTSFPGVPFAAATVYHILHALGFTVSVYDACLFFPVFMGVMTCGLMYFLGRELGGSTVGLFAAFFMAISQPFIGRTALGFYDTENTGIFCMTALSLFFLRSIDKEKTLPWTAFYSVLSGLFLGYAFASWGAARYPAGLLALFMVASLVLKLYERRYLISYCITIGVGYTIAAMVPHLGINFVTSVESMAAFVVAFFVMVYEVARRVMDERRVLLLMVSIFVLLAVAVFGLESLGVIKPIGIKFWRVIDPSRGLQNVLFSSVAEHKRSTWTSFFGEFGLILILGMFGTFYALKNLDGKRLYGALLFATAMYFACSMTRLSLILSIPAALMPAFGLNELMRPFVRVSSQLEDSRRARRRRAAFGVGRELTIVFTLFIFVAMLPSVWGSIEAAYTPGQLTCSSIYAYLGGSFPQDWPQALQWMRDNLPEDAIVVSWWDYGYWIETLANRTTLADGATLNGTQIGNIGKILMLNQTGSIPILKKYNATHIVVFNAFNPGNPTQAIGHGDNVKWSWMVEIGHLNITDYRDENGNPTDKYEKSTLYRLMTRNPDSAFKLAFASQYNFVLVYEVDYGAAQT